MCYIYISGDKYYRIHAGVISADSLSDLPEKSVSRKSEEKKDEDDSAQMVKREAYNDDDSKASMKKS